LSSPTRILPRESADNWSRWQLDALHGDALHGDALHGDALHGDPRHGDGRYRDARSAAADAIPGRAARASRAHAAGRMHPTDEAAAGAGSSWPTAEEVAEIRRAAAEDGFHEGAAAARAEAVRLVALVERVHADAARLEGEVAEKVLDLAVQIAREVIRGEVRCRPDALLPVIQEALGALPQTLHHLAIHLHPDDAELVGRHLQDHPLPQPARLRPNAQIERGGCQISASEGDLDATLRTRWARVLAALGRDDAWHDE
jgi:flagellar assembly protein FliH